MDIIERGHILSSPRNLDLGCINFDIEAAASGCGYDAVIDNRISLQETNRLIAVCKATVAVTPRIVRGRSVGAT